MHILFLSDNFPPEVNAPASRTFEHTRQWVKAGHKVTVITCVPNFPSGKLLDGYKNWLWQTEIIDSIKVIRVWSFITANSGFALRVLDYLSYMIMAVLASLFVRKVDVVIGTSPQFFTAVAAYIVTMLKRCPFVFELRDLWPASIKAVGVMRDSVLIRVLDRIELFLYRKADLIISVTQSFKTKLVHQGIDGDKIVVITNGVDLSQFKPRPKDKALLSSLGLEDDFICGYIGTHGVAHGLETLLDAAELFQKAGNKKINILMLGNGANKDTLVSDVAKRKLHNVTFIDSVPKDEVIRYWSLLDVSIIHLCKNDVFKMVIPSKIFESMAMGIPLIHAVEGESAEIVESNKCGKCIPSQEPNLMVDTILDLKQNVEDYADYRKHCLKTARIFDRNHLADEMLTSLVKLQSENSKTI